MKIRKIPAQADAPIERIYIAAATLANFRGYSDVELQLFRTGAAQEELERLKEKNLVGPPDPSMPTDALAGATEQAALECVLEAFTETEIQKLADYLEERYSGQFNELNICPMDLPVPLGVGPLAKIPESENTGFINFDLAPDYPLDFGFRGYFDLNNA